MDYEPLEIIGHGSFGKIRKVRRIADDEILVRKEISYKSMNTKEKAQLISEFKILKSLNHPNIVQYLHHEHLPESHQVYLYMEYCGGGDLGDLIREFTETGRSVPEHLIWTIFTQLVLALYRCHYNADPAPCSELLEPCGTADSDDNATSRDPPRPERAILHRDIKPDNVFLGHNTCVKLGDFGLAKVLDSDNRLATTYVGTPYYMSPEVLLDQPSTTQSDVWSLGCVVYELAALHPPFQAKSHLQLAHVIRSGVYPPLQGYSSTLIRTVSAMLSLNPAQRPPIASLLRLDVIKLFRKDRELAQGFEELALRERLVAQREELLQQQQLEYRHAVESEIYARLEVEIPAAIEAEINRRVAAVLDTKRDIAPDTGQDYGHAGPDTAQTHGYARSHTHRHSSSLSSIRPTYGSPDRRKFAAQQSPSDTSMESASVSASPLSVSVGPLSTTNPSPNGPLTPRNVRGPRSIIDSFITPSPSKWTANWNVARAQRVAPHYSAVDDARLRSAGPAAKTPVLGIKGPPKPVKDDDWDDIPSPFLRRWERV